MWKIPQTSVHRMLCRKGASADDEIYPRGNKTNRDLICLVRRWEYKLSVLGMQTGTSQCDLDRTSKGSSDIKV